MKKIMLIAVLVGLMGCGKVVQDGKHNKIITIILRENIYTYTINGKGDMENRNIEWVSEKDLGLKPGDLVTITKVEEAE